MGLSIENFDPEKAAKELKKDIAFIKSKKFPKEQEEGMIFLLQRDFNELKKLSEIRKQNFGKGSK